MPSIDCSRTVIGEWFGRKIWFYVNEISVWTLFRTSTRSEETDKLPSAAGVSEVSYVTVNRLPCKGVESRFEVAIEIPVGQGGRQSPIEKDGKYSFCKKWSMTL